MGRQSVWSDEELIELTRDFVCVADEVAYLAAGKGNGGELFVKFSKQVPSEKWNTGQLYPTGTKQGLYLMMPDGTYLGSFPFCNNLNKAKAEVKAALATWKKIVAEKELQPQPVPNPAGKPMFDPYPNGGLQLQINYRDLAAPEATACAVEQEPCPAETTQPKRNRTGRQNTKVFDVANGVDWLQLSKEEVAGLVPTARGKNPVPEDLMTRLARYYLVDAVRGHTFPWQSGSVQEAWMNAEIVRKEQDLLTIRYTGKAFMEQATANYKHDRHGRQLAMHDQNGNGGEMPVRPGIFGYDCTLYGTAVYNTNTRRFELFELVAGGERYGGGPYSYRRTDFDIQPSPMGICFTIEGQYKTTAAAEAAAEK